MLKEQSLAQDPRPGTILLWPLGYCVCVTTC